MKITEVTELNEQELLEAIEQNNDTGLKSKDVVKIIQSQSQTWSEPRDADEAVLRLYQLVGQAHAKK